MSVGGTQAAGLGTRGARVMLVVVWGLGLWSTVMDSPDLPVARVVVGAALQLVCLLLLASPGEGQLSAPRAATCAGAAVLAGVVALPLVVPPEWAWPYNFPNYLLGLLTTRGNVLSGVLGGALLIGAGWAHGRALGASGGDLAVVLVLPVVTFVLGILWRLAIASALGRERQSRAVASASQIAAEAAEAATARDQALIDEVRAEAGPVLEEIRAGAPIGHTESLRISAVEEGIRDRIRSPGLRHPALDGAVRAARLRGVGVTLLGSEASGGARLGASLAREIGAILEGVDEGSVTIREHPAGSRAALSVVVRQGSETRRLTLAGGAPATERASDS